MWKIVENLPKNVHLTYMSICVCLTVCPLNEDDIKNKDDLKNEDNLKNEDDLKNEEDHES